MDILQILKPLARGRRRMAMVPLAGSAGQRMQRVQIGLFGLGCMVLLVGLADIVITRAQQTEATVVPAAAAPPEVGTSEEPARRDPLADAGVVPELPAEPEAPAVPGPPQETRDVPPLRQPTLE